MKRVVYLLIILFLFSFSLSGQQIDEIGKKETKIYFGVSSGLFLSELISSIIENYPHGRGIDITYENKFIPGLFEGCSLEMQYSNSFSLQTELNYNNSNHKMLYLDWTDNGPVSTGKYADYKISYSNLRLCLFPAYSMGKKAKIALFGGPDIIIPFLLTKKGQIEVKSYNFLTHAGSSYYIKDNSIEMNIHGGIGLMFGIRIDCPINKNLLRFEVRNGRSIYNLTENPYLKEKFYIISIRYSIRIK